MKTYDWEKLIFISLSALLGAALLGSLLPVFGYTGKAMVILSTLPKLTLLLHWIALICGIVGFLGYLYYNNLLKKDGYSNEEGSFYDQKEKRIQITKAFSSFSIIINFMILGLTQSNELPAYYNWVIWVNTMLGFGGAFANNSLIAKVRPDLDENLTGSGFNKMYFEKLDEREKEKAGRASFKTINFMGFAYLSVLFICSVLIRSFNVSPIICLPVGVLWFLQTVTMLYYSCKAH